MFFFVFFFSPKKKEGKRASENQEEKFAQDLLNPPFALNIFCLGGSAIMQQCPALFNLCWIGEPAWKEDKLIGLLNYWCSSGSALPSLFLLFLAPVQCQTEVISSPALPLWSLANPFQIVTKFVVLLQILPLVPFQSNTAAHQYWCIQPGDSPGWVHTRDAKATQETVLQAPPKQH